MSIWFNKQNLIERTPIKYVIKTETLTIQKCAQISSIGYPWATEVSYDDVKYK